MPRTFIGGICRKRGETIEMRLKQLLGIILLAGVTTLAAGSVSQLAGVRVETRDNAVLITVRANGTFSHTEYRPSDNLMLVDLTGVSVGQQDAGIHPVSAAGILSYRVVGYHATSGAEVTRVELNLAHGANVKISDIDGGVGVELRVSNAATPAAKISAEKPSTPAQNGSSGSISHISNVTVVRGQDSLNVEVSGTSPMTVKTMKLTNPDRVVLDIPNSVLSGSSREIAVNSDNIRAVRAAHYQSAPPTTRIVVDMAAAREFEVVPAANKLVLKLKNATVAPQGHSTERQKEVIAQQSAPAPEPAPVIVSASASAPTAVSGPEPAAAPTTQSDPVQSQLTVKTLTQPAEPQNTATAAKRPASNEAPVKKEDGQARALQAAAHFVDTSISTTPKTNEPAFAASSSLAAQPAAINAALQQQAASVQQPAQPQASVSAMDQMSTGCTTGHYTGAPFNLNLKDLDIKDFFRLISDISGLNVVLDPSVKGTLTIVLNDVPWDQALAIVLNNNGLECQLHGNVLRIATLETLKTEAEARRAQQEAQALAVPKQTYTRYLSYAHSKDMVTLVKRFLSARGDVVSDDRSNALIIEDIPATLPKIDSLLTALDRKTPEVEIEARVVAATRSFARDIGTQLGFGWGNAATGVGGGTGINSPIAVTPPTGVTPAFITAPGNTALIPLFSNLPATGPTSGISFTNFSSIYRLDFVLTMAETRGLLKILSRPRVVTQNNIQALVRQGTRIPVVTQAQLGGPPTVTYVDAFLRLTVTPQITAENTIFLNVDVENTVHEFSRVTGAQVNPTLQTQQTTTQVLVSDGTTVVIGGVIQVQNSVAIEQVPLLGSIPLLGNLFKRNTVNTNNQELIFFITPKIIQT